MDFPTMVYKKGGPHSYKGGTYDYLGVKNDAELKKALSGGWATTLPEAMGEQPAVQPVEVPDDTAPPTRAELEKQAGELGIKFTKKTTDDELNAKINAALSE